MPFEPKEWKDEEGPAGLVDAAALIDLEERVTSEAALPDSVVTDSRDAPAKYQVLQFDGSAFVPVDLSALQYDTLNLGTVTLTGEVNPSVDVLQVGVDGEGALRPQHITSADQTGTGAAAAMNINPGHSTGENQEGASIGIAGGRSTGNALGGAVRFGGTPAGEAGSKENATVFSWEVLANGNLLPMQDSAYAIGGPNVRPVKVYAVSLLSANLNTPDRTTEGGAEAITIVPGHPLGANQAGATLALKGGRSRGSALGGAIRLYTSPAGAAGEAENAGVERWIVEATGHLKPAATKTYDIGSAALRVRGGYFETVNLEALRLAASLAATGPVGTVVGKQLVSNSAGEALGYVPIYDKIT